MAEWLNTPAIVIAILAILGLGWKAAYWASGVDKDRSALKENAEKDRSSFKDVVKEIRDDIKKILGRLPPVPVTASSPLQLTDFGKSISKEIDAKEWAEKLASELVERVRGNQPYEIQEFAKRVCAGRTHT